jgi:Fe-S-cluster containining protein
MTIPVFDCRMCGHCCQGQGGIVASAPELERLAAFMGLSVEEFRDRYTQAQGKKTVLRCGEDGFCVFFDAEKACTVHPAKPDVCRAWPFFRGNLADAVSWELAQDYCPGIVAASGHAEFARQGIAYVRDNGLAKSGREDEANALRIADLTEES